MPTGIKEKILPTKRHKLVHYQLSKVSSFHIRKSLVSTPNCPKRHTTTSENVVQGKLFSYWQKV